MTDEELETIARDSAMKFFYIRKNGYYYRDKACGYTDKVYQAGVYIKTVAIMHAVGCRDLFLEPIDIQEHNKMITDEIESLMSRFIGHSFGEQPKNRWDNNTK